MTNQAVEESALTHGDSLSGEDAKFWRILRDQVLPLRPSQYDLTSICNLACEGCLFFSGGDYLGHRDQNDLAVVDQFFAAEAARGVRYGYFGGAEPSMVEEKLVAAARHLPYGVVFTNGTRRLTDEIPYRIHVSVWGKPERSRKLRGADIFAKQAANYRGDRRAVFVFTITAQNIDDLEFVASVCADNGLALTFNHYSPTRKYLDFIGGRSDGDKYHAISAGEDNLLLGLEHLQRAQTRIAALVEQPGSCIVYAPEISGLIHDPAGLYSDLDPETEVARDCAVRLTTSLRHYNTDLQPSSEKCCTPNVQCRTCRLYAQSFATVLARATRGARQPGGMVRLVRLWRLWCELFLNNEGLRRHP